MISVFVVVGGSDWGRLRDIGVRILNCLDEDDIIIRMKYILNRLEIFEEIITFTIELFLEVVLFLEMWVLLSFKF